MFINLIIILFHMRKLVTTFSIILISLFFSVVCLSFSMPTGAVTPSDLKVFSDDVEAQKYVQYEFVDKASYINAKKSAVPFLSRDSSGVIHKKGSLILKCKNKEVVLTNSQTTDEEGREEFEEYVFIGKLLTSNRFMIQSHNEQSTQYYFVDGITGEHFEQKTNVPFVSPNGKHIVSFEPGALDVSCSLSIVDPSKMESIVSLNFESYLPASFYQGGDDKEVLYGTAKNSTPIFWSSDNCLYFPVIEFKQDSPLQDQPNKYLKLKIK